MLWELIDASVKGLASFLLFHEFRRLTIVALLCKKNDIKHTQSTILALITVSLSTVFLIYSIATFQSLFHRYDSLTEAEADAQAPLLTRKVYVDKVLNGDTIESASGETIVYSGIDAPEFGRKRGWLGESSMEATEFNRELVEGKTVVMEVDRTERDKYGRIPAYVFSDGVFVNAELVRRGLALATSYHPSGKYNKLFLRLQSEAKKSELGIWKYARSSADSPEESILGNKNTKIYHLPDGRYYDLVSPKNRIYFQSEDDAAVAGYRRSRR